MKRAELNKTDIPLTAAGAEKYDSDELRDDRQIDPRRLDENWLEQSDLFVKWAERVVDAKAHEEFCEYQLEAVTAKLMIDAADDPASFGISKPTVDAIKAAVKLHVKYEQAARAYRLARKNRGLLEVAVKAMSIRKDSLENLVILHGQQYFAGPDVPRDLVTAWEKSRGPGGKLQRQKAKRREGREEDD